MLCMLDSIRELLAADDFRPFRVVLTNGHGYDIRQPDLAVLLKTQLFVTRPASDQFSLLRLNQIAAIELLPTAA